MCNNIIEVKINDIEIGKRHRKDMGDIEGLAESVEETGLLQPIGITPDYKLVFGERRLRAYRDVMKRETIPARIVDVESVLHGQFAENMMRKKYTVSERVAIVKALRSHQHGGDRRSKQARQCEVETLTVNEAAKRVGFSKDSFYRAGEAIEKGIPELVEAMDSGKLSINAAHKLAQAEPDEQEECLVARFDEGKATARAIGKALTKIRRQKERAENLTREAEPPSSDTIHIYNCRFQDLEVVAGIEPNSVKLICTDIPYGKEFVGSLEEFAEFAERVLMPGGLFVAHVGQYALDEKMKLLGKHLNYQWLGTSVWDVKANPHLRLKVVSKSIPIVIFSKGEWKPRRKWCDKLHFEVQEKEWHEWQRPLPEIERLVQYFSEPGDLVVDPCGGGFTTAIACYRQNRHFIGCDVDKAAVTKGQDRLKEESTVPVILPINSISLNTVTEGDCRDLIPALPDRSINLCVTSPPYADQRKDMYPGISESGYPVFTFEWMSKIWDKLTDDGSVLIVIDPAVKAGVVSEYVLRTQLALHEAGWKEHQTQIWLKRDRGPLGHNQWPRHCYETILWFSKSAKPFCDPRMSGKLTDHRTMNNYAQSRWTNGGKPGKKGIARVSNVWDIPVGGNEKGVDHPAKFPVALPKALIQTFCPPGGVVLDNFAGSGSTLIAAKQLGCSYYGFDIMPEYVKLAQERLAEFEPPALPEAG